MAIPIWPVTLPQCPLNDSFTESIGSTIIRSDMDTGPAKVRRIQSKGINVFQASYILNNEEKSILDDFIDISLYGGVRVFWWSQYPNKSILVRLRPSGEEIYSYTRNSSRWSVSLTLEAMP